MKRKVVFLGALAGLLIAIAGSLFYMKNNRNVTRDNIVITPTPTPLIGKVMHEDQSGFILEYPNNLKLDKHDEDTQNYAHLEFTSDTHLGRIIIWAKDTNTASLDSLMKSKKVDNAIDTNLGREAAKKYLGGKDGKTVFISTIFGGYLYELETDSGGEEISDYWMNVTDDMVKSFKFKEILPEENNAGSDDYIQEEDFSDADEIIE